MQASMGAYQWEHFQLCNICNVVEIPFPCCLSELGILFVQGDKLDRRVDGDGVNAIVIIWLRSDNLGLFLKVHQKLLV